MEELLTGISALLISGVSTAAQLLALLYGDVSTPGGGRGHVCKTQTTILWLLRG